MGDHERSLIKICVGVNKEKPNRLKSSQKQVNNFPDKLEFVGESNMPKG